VKDLIEDISLLPVTNKIENTWVNKRLVPVSIKLVELDKVIEVINRNPADDTIKEIITDLENLSNDYTIYDEQNILFKHDLDTYIQQLKDRI
jgi:hypothetical protein